MHPHLLSLTHAYQQIFANQYSLFNILCYGTIMCGRSYFAAQHTLPQIIILLQSISFHHSMVHFMPY
jgi:hypothetical protein